jgi:RNA polymerase sigma-70 factor (ECF subfamily)
MGIRAFITRHPVVQGILLHWTSPIGRLVGSHLASGEARAQDGGSGMSATGGCTMTEQPSFRDAYQRWWCIARDAADEILRSPDDAEDVAQRVLVKAWTSGTLAGGEHAESYFRVAARREAWNLLRDRIRRRNRESKGTREIREFMAQPPRPADEQLSIAESQRFCAAAISRLPARCQLVCSLVFLHGCSHAEVARELQISEKAVHKQVARGRRILSTYLARSQSKVSTLVDGGGKAVAVLYERVGGLARQPPDSWSLVTLATSQPTRRGRCILDSESS